MFFLPPFAGLKWKRPQTGLLAYGFQELSNLKFLPNLHAFPFAVNSGDACGFRGQLQLRGQRRNRTALPEHLRRIKLSIDCNSRRTISDEVHFVKCLFESRPNIRCPAPSWREETSAATASRER
jgi:hypothetical protein